MNSWEKLEKTKLPLYNNLKMKSISNNNHEHPQQVWNTMEKLLKVVIMTPT